jgi:hypothetical protein
VGRISAKAILSNVILKMTVFLSDVLVNAVVVMASILMILLTNNVKIIGTMKTIVNKQISVLKFAVRHELLLAITTFAW